MLVSSIRVVHLTAEKGTEVMHQVPHAHLLEDALILLGPLTLPDTSEMATEHAWHTLDKAWTCKRSRTCVRWTIHTKV